MSSGGVCALCDCGCLEGVWFVFWVRLVCFPGCGVFCMLVLGVDFGCLFGMVAFVVCLF